MSLRGKIRKLAVIVALTGAAAVAAPTSAMAWGHAPVPSSSQSLESGSAGVGMFGPHASWLNIHDHSEG
ncbi:hypothetical protein [Kitasatospora aureofaciens]|uniref:hypothetical protein n=1 Tax=Kitasatospora aureofaciens TaxID=1894 RepID=UPI001C49370E|nr:hypothetical protein [Kitasatospora aureofaciens]MBV6698933.1 hypothetical protein [Kitasatospora aureofaciens]